MTYIHFWYSIYLSDYNISLGYKILIIALFATFCGGKKLNKKVYMTKYSIIIGDFYV